MSEVQVKKVLLKMPSFTRFLIGGLAAYWLSTIMNPAFGIIALLVILIIPILTVDNIMAKQFHRAYNPPPQVVPKVISKREYLASISEPEKVEEPVPETPEKAKSRLLAETEAKPKGKKGK